METSHCNNRCNTRLSRSLTLATWALVAVMGIDGATISAAEPREAVGHPAPLIWDFESDALAAAGEPFGQLRFAECGPTSETFKGMPAQNRALRLEKPGAYLRIADPDVNGPLDFRQGDPITMEAWVRIDSIRNGANVYVIGKGRTYESSRSENHNYALRLSGSGEAANVSFLFSTLSPDSGQSQYHRWTSSDGFVPDGAWHHIAVSYLFGTPESIEGFIDGRASKGKWDKGGATRLPPVNDNEAVWIGSSRGGEPANSLVGELDDIQIHRRLVDAREISTRREVIPRAPAWPTTADDRQVTITLFESAGSHLDFPTILPEEAFRFSAPMLALHRLPLKYLPGGARDVWQGPLLMQAFVQCSFPEGELELLVRSPGRSRLWIDDQLLVVTPPRRLFPDSHQPFVIYKPDLPWLRVPRVGDSETRLSFTSKGGVHRVVLESLVGAKASRCEVGETLVAMRQGEGMFTLAAPAVREDPSAGGTIHLVDEEFLAYREQLDKQLDRIDRQSLTDESAKEDAYWDERHRLARESLASWADEALAEPLQGDKETHGNDRLRENNHVDRLINATLPSDGISTDGLAPDLAFLRRLSLDTVGVPPSLAEMEAFLAIGDETERRRSQVARLLADDRWADHWVSYWQDVLAENPNILKPKLNNTGPFRWWLHDALVLNKPMDRFATELIRMEGSIYAGASAGFGLATENDVPMAEKAHIISGAFLAVDLKCARCHDAPYHPWSQKDLFGIGAMLANKAIKVPETSSVPKAFFDRKGDESPISVTLQPGDIVQPEWPASIFDNDEFGGPAVDERLLGREPTSREMLAAMITRGENQRFAAASVNRLWTRLMGWGLMDDTDDWYAADARNRPLLDYLSRELVLAGYDMKHVASLILQSRAYQRQPIDKTSVDRELLYSAPWRRRLSAEQVVDSLHRVTGRPMDTEPITFDLEASQKIENFLNLGTPTRAWHLTSLSNERDRPSLSLPKAATVVECLEAFGWRQSRQSPITHREYEANMVQPGVIAHGALTGSLTRLTDGSAITEQAIAAESVEQFVDQLFMIVLTRPPTPAERAVFARQLGEGFEDRLRTVEASQKPPPVSRGFATWSNHFSAEANELMRQIEREVAAGPEPTQRLAMDWRERAEDALWALVNSPEFQFVP